jgi:RNA polymerase sigma-70 factor (ECF subfamily)
MANSADLETRASLLERLGRTPTDAEAWREFAVHYGAVVLEWCRKWDLQEADAQDVTQNVMLKLAEKMQSFAYDPAKSFRGWLRTLAHHAWADFVEGRKRPGHGSGDSAVGRILDSTQAREELSQRLEAQYDRELLELASQVVRLRITPQTWDAFRLTAVDGLSGADAAQRLGMSVAHVFTARHRVQTMLREEIAKRDV